MRWWAVGKGESCTRSAMLSRTCTGRGQEAPRNAVSRVPPSRGRPTAQCAGAMHVCARAPIVTTRSRIQHGGDDGVCTPRRVDAQPCRYSRRSRELDAIINSIDCLSMHSLPPAVAI
ncbi:hypothetical protein EVAR_44110_1 [Eumeta japonica]|uniref:Uncharacterized protein n=1 Tax=Eumeta variegata TaxID=151549 RepID=A0A4C1X2T5_EUMVA|nr:hypothetical protein EVAR_44110_1 [Eumeta japonica]